MSGRRFPVLADSRERREHPDTPWDVPWEFLVPHEPQALRNHCDQTLERLAERGGLGVCEMVAIVEDRRWSRMDPGAALARLAELLEEWNLQQAAAREVAP